MDLHGKVALVTGGAVRVGKAIVVALAQAGADVAFSYHASTAEAEQTQREIEALGRRAHAQQADAGRVAECRALVDGTVSALGRLDILVNSASLWKRTKFAELNEADWDQVTAILLKGVAFTSHAAAPHLAAHGDGAIVNITDLSAFVPFPNHIAHSAGKAGIVSLTKSLALGIGPTCARQRGCTWPGPAAPWLHREADAGERGAHAAWPVGQPGRCCRGRRVPGPGQLHNGDRNRGGRGRTHRLAAIAGRQAEARRAPVVRSAQRLPPVPASRTASTPR